MTSLLRRKRRITASPASRAATRGSQETSRQGDRETRREERAEGILSPCLPVSLSRCLALALAATLSLGQASAQQPPRPVQPDIPREKTDQFQKDFQVQLEPSGPDRSFRIESEAALRERIRQEFRNRSERADFPREVELVRPGESLQARYFPPTASLYVPDAVCYKPLYFEDKNVERNGWDAGVFQ